MLSPLLRLRKQKGDSVTPCPHGCAARAPPKPLLMEARSPHSLWHCMSQESSSAGLTELLEPAQLLMQECKLALAKHTARKETLLKIRLFLPPIFQSLANASHYQQPTGNLSQGSLESIVCRYPARMIQKTAQKGRTGAEHQTNSHSSALYTKFHM